MIYQLRNWLCWWLWRRRQSWVDVKPEWFWTNHSVE